MTDHTPPFPRPTGSLSARIKGAELILRDRSIAARAASYNLEDPNGQLAASLRGKAIAYNEAAELMRRIDKGRLLGLRKWTRKAK